MREELKLIPGEVYYVYNTGESTFSMLGKALDKGKADGFGVYRSEAKFIVITKRYIESKWMNQWAYYDDKGFRKFRLATSHEKRFFEKWERTGIIDSQIFTSYLRWFLNHKKWK